MRACVVVTKETMNVVVGERAQPSILGEKQVQKNYGTASTGKEGERRSRQLSICITKTHTRWVGKRLQPGMAVDLPKITVQSEDSEEEVEAARRRRRRRTGLAELPAVLVGVAMVVVGALYHADCVYSKVTGSPWPMRLAGSIQFNPRLVTELLSQNELRNFSADPCISSIRIAE